MSFPRLRPYPQNGTLSVANGANHVINRGGTFVRVREADQAFKILLDDDVELKAELNDIFRLKDGDSFDRVTIINDSGATLAFQLEIGFGGVETNNVSLSGTLKTAAQGHASLVTTADDSIAATTTVLVLAANTDRKEAIITNLADNGAKIRVGDSNTGASRGVELSPGQSITLETTAAIYVYNAGAASQSVALLEVE